jgi:hypothetical protein
MPKFCNLTPASLYPQSEEILRRVRVALLEHRPLSTLALNFTEESTREMIFGIRSDIQVLKVPNTGGEL